MIDIFSYTDYRQYLKDFTAAEKQRNPVFSHRYFAMKAGIKSSGFYSDVLNGKRNLTNTLVLKFAKALKLNKSQLTYFQNMVGFCQAKTHDEQTHFYRQMLGSTKLPISQIEKDKLEFYSKWYYSAVRELLYFYKFSSDYEGLARALNPSLSVIQAKKAIELLERLELIKRDNRGFFKQSTPLITTGDNFKDINIANFQRATLKLAGESLERFDKDVRESSTLTMTLSEKSYLEAQKEVTALRKKLLHIAHKDEKVDRVYQCNFHLFPLSKF